ncbi:hypothetical protein EXIGLDRAFT_769777 [Exidia glandulosa HHB12029]|uniref:Uncharacterized protein n=1 Tax=Exidia glandulosa HHB12029 TaxID=1314781 RepID=A0A165H6S9_EXIGL|nr:hypothetical protein EXIGLDRAFT_769777 [Exidia glandulosa HHB12029]
MPSPPPPASRRQRPANIFDIAFRTYFASLCSYTAIATLVVVGLSVLATFNSDIHQTLRYAWAVLRFAFQLVTGTVSVAGSAASVSRRAWCAIPGPRWGCDVVDSGGPLTLEVAAHRVKHTAVTSLDVFESFARGMRASLSDRVSYIDLWAMSDAVTIMEDVPDGKALAMSLAELKDVVMKVEDGVADINRKGWQSFASIDRWVARVRDSIVQMRAAGRTDERELHKLLAQLATSSRGNVDELIALIDRTLRHTHAGLDTASAVRRHALASGHELERRLKERSLPQKVWEAGSHAVQLAKKNVKNIQAIYDATNDVQGQLGLVRRYLVDYQSNAANFHSDINAMEILTLDQELRELEYLGKKIETVLSEARKVNREAFEGSQARSLDS